MKNPKIINKNDIAFFENITFKDINKKFFIDNFASTEKRKEAKFLTNDIINEISLRKFGNNKKISTTTGRWVYNVFMNGNTEETRSNMFYKINGYVNFPLTKKNIGKIANNMAKALVDDVITSDEYIEYIDRQDWIAYSTVFFLAPGINNEIVIPNKKIIEHRDMLFDKFHKELKIDKDPAKASLIENELMDMAKKELDHYPGMDIYKSGCRGSFNSYKNSSIMRGPLYAADHSDIIISKENLISGIPPEEFNFYEDNLVIGGSSRGKETQKGGYIAKQMTSAFQSVLLGEPGSDCGTKETLRIKLSEKNINQFEYRYILENGVLIQLNKNNMNKYKNKIVNLRSPLYCKDDKICSKCAGELFYKIGITNVGLTFARVGTRILNLSLKLFHDQTIHTRNIDPNDFIL